MFFSTEHSDEKQNKMRKKMMLCLSALHNNTGPAYKVTLSLEDEDRREGNWSCPEALQERI